MTRPSPLPQPPVPVATADSAPFWAAAAAHELVMQRCSACSRLQTPARRYCRHCHTDTLRWEPMKKRARLASFTHVMRGPTRAFHEPYTLALIELDEGVRMMVQLRGADRETAAIGDPVIIGFETLAGTGVCLPVARRTAEA